MTEDLLLFFYKNFFVILSIFSSSDNCVSFPFSLCLLSTLKTNSRVLVKASKSLLRNILQFILYLGLEISSAFQACIGIRTVARLWRVLVGGKKKEEPHIG